MLTLFTLNIDVVDAEKNFRREPGPLFRFTLPDSPVTWLRFTLLLESTNCA